MPLVINTNVGALKAQRSLGLNASMLQKSMEKLASGYRINGAGDDAAGLQISEIMRAQIRGSQKALDNTQDGINLLNTADGALSQVTDILQRMRELAVQAANDTLAAAQRSSIKAELDQLGNQITLIGDGTEFNNKKLLDGTISGTGSMKIQVGANSATATNSVDIYTVLKNVDAASLAVDSTSLLVSNYSEAISAIDRIDTAISSINKQRGDIGAYINRFDYVTKSLGINIENQSAAESRIRNVDVAAETSRLTQYQILQQASVSILSQSNQTPSLALSLLNG